LGYDESAPGKGIHQRPAAKGQVRNLIRGRISRGGKAFSQILREEKVNLDFGGNAEKGEEPAFLKRKLGGAFL
jgi:hypothetical protein